MTRACRLVGPYWDMVGEWHLEQQSKDLIVARFDCEQCVVVPTRLSLYGSRQILTTPS